MTIPKVTGLKVTGAGAVAGERTGPAALEPAGDADAGTGEVKAFATAFKRRTQQRYIDKAAETGIKALHDAAEAAGLTAEAVERAPQRIGILIATRLGPVPTRDQYLDSYANRGGKSASATLFSNCGYNIVGSMLARSLGVRGPVLTFGAGRGWPSGLLSTARLLFAGRRTDLVFVGRAEADEAVMLALAPPETPGGLPLDLAAGVPDAAGLADDAVLAHLAALWWRGRAGDAAGPATLAAPTA
jgi:3-oxoacyl-(acyl-carrier-protein) synthase